MSDPILPIVHLNGTSRDELIDLRRNAMSALHDALYFMAKMHPHGRDYYPVDGLYEQALAQHAARVQAVESVYDSITEEALALQKGGRS